MISQTRGYVVLRDNLFNLIHPSERYGGCMQHKVGSFRSLDASIRLVDRQFLTSYAPPYMSD